jgi:hypothetical protein
MAESLSKHERFLGIRPSDRVDRETERVTPDCTSITNSLVCRADRQSCPSIGCS